MMEQVCEMAKTLSVYLCYVYGFNETYLFLLFNHGRQRGRDKHSPEVVVSLKRKFFLCSTKRCSLEQNSGCLDPQAMVNRRSKYERIRFLNFELFHQLALRRKMLKTYFLKHYDRK